MREDIVVRNFGEEPAYCSVELQSTPTSPTCSTSRKGRVEPTGDATRRRRTTAGIVFRWRRGAVRRGAQVRFSEPAQVAVNLAVFEVIVPPARHSGRRACSSRRS